MTDEEVDLLVSGLEDQQGQINYEGIVYKDKNVDMIPLFHKPRSTVATKISVGCAVGLEDKQR